MSPTHASSSPRSASKRAARLHRTRPSPVAAAPTSARLGPCETCGNVYDKAFEVLRAGVSHVFDSFECAISALAPTCVHCGCRIVGHGMEKQGRMFCCAHCASRSGASEMRDRS